MASWGLTDEDVAKWSQWFAGHLREWVGARGADAQLLVAREVDFAENRLSARGVRVLLETLARNKLAVQVLKLHHNRIEAEGGIARFIASCQGHLRELHLSHNELTTTAAEEIIAAAVEAKSVHGTFFYPQQQQGRGDSQKANGSGAATAAGAGAAPLWLRLEQNCVDTARLSERAEAVAERCKRPGRALCSVSGSGCTPRCCLRHRDQPPAVHAKHLGNQRQKSAADVEVSSVPELPTLLSGSDKDALPRRSWQGQHTGDRGGPRAPGAAGTASRGGHAQQSPSSSDALVWRVKRQPEAEHVVPVTASAGSSKKQNSAGGPAVPPSPSMPLASKGVSGPAAVISEKVTASLLIKAKRQEEIAAAKERRSYPRGLLLSIRRVLAAEEAIRSKGTSAAEGSLEQGTGEATTAATVALKTLLEHKFPGTLATATLSKAMTAPSTKASSKPAVAKGPRRGVQPASCDVRQGKDGFSLNPQAAEFVPSVKAHLPVGSEFLADFSSATRPSTGISTVVVPGAAPPGALWNTQAPEFLPTVHGPMVSSAFTPMPSQDGVPPPPPYTAYGAPGAPSQPVNVVLSTCPKATPSGDSTVAAEPRWTTVVSLPPAESKLASSGVDVQQRELDGQEGEQDEVDTSASGHQSFSGEEGEKAEELEAQPAPRLRNQAQRNSEGCFMRAAAAVVAALTCGGFHLGGRRREEKDQ